MLNIGTAKFVAVLLVLVLGGYHAVLHATYGVTPCKGLLTTGMYKVSLKSTRDMLGSLKSMYKGYAK